MGGKW
jgi:transposase InsO family protein